jgi:hypothetical protein
MAFTITNRAKMTLIIPLNSGGSLYLAPGESSSPIEDYDLANNDKVDKLLRDNLITWSQGEAQAATAAGNESHGVPVAVSSGGGTPPDTRTTSAINTSPAPDASSDGPGASASGVEGHGGKGRNK